MRTLLKNARILKMTDENILFSSMVIIDDRIAYIGDDYEGYGPFDIIHDCKGNVIMPGFKNAHTHSAMTLLRSRADDMPLADWLNKQIFPVEAKLTAEDIYYLTQLAILEYLDGGVTSIFDMYLTPESIADACRDAGMNTQIRRAYRPVIGVTDVKIATHS